MFDSIPTSQTSTSSLVNHFRSQRTTTSASHTSSTLSLGSSSMTFTNVRSATHRFSSPYKQLTSPAAIRAASSAAAWKAWENDMAEKVKNIYIYTHLQHRILTFRCILHTCTPPRNRLCKAKLHQEKEQN